MAEQAGRQAGGWMNQRTDISFYMYIYIYIYIYRKYVCIYFLFFIYVLLVLDVAMNGLRTIFPL